MTVGVRTVNEDLGIVRAFSEWRMVNASTKSLSFELSEAAQ